MEWMLLVVGVSVVAALWMWLVRRGSGRRDAPAHPARDAAPRTPGIEDSMSMRLPTGGNSGT